VTRFGVLWPNRRRALPKSPLGTVIEYVTNSAVALKRQLEAGYLVLDNNLIERTLRVIVRGRNNWGAIGSEVGGKTAMLYSVVGTCKHLGISPLASMSLHTVRRTSVRFGVGFDRVLLFLGLSLLILRGVRLNPLLEEMDFCFQAVIGRSVGVSLSPQSNPGDADHYSLYLACSIEVIPQRFGLLCRLGCQCQFRV
jgi:hypothetical protein